MMQNETEIRAAALNEAAALCDEQAATFDKIAKDAHEMAGSDAGMRQASITADAQKDAVMRLARKIRALIAKPAAE